MGSFRHDDLKMRPACAYKARGMQCKDIKVISAYNFQCPKCSKGNSRKDLPVWRQNPFHSEVQPRYAHVNFVFEKTNPTLSESALRLALEVGQESILIWMALSGSLRAQGENLNPICDCGCTVLFKVLSYRRTHTYMGEKKCNSRVQTYKLCCSK